MNSQPSFADLGTPLFDTTFVVVDLETTGTGPAARITEIGAVKIRGGEWLGEFQTLVNPEIAIPAYITSLTSISNQMVAQAPTIAAVLPAFLTFASGAVLVAHNAGFDIGFLKRAAADLDYPWPKTTVLDTVALARRALLRDEVPNHRLGTLAHHFHSTAEPNHRALSDARATVDVLHGLLERVGSLGVTTLEELVEFIHWVSPIRKAKRIWAQTAPTAPGVYFFIHDDGDHRQYLYVGKSRNLRSRIRNYFTASESRPRIDEMLTIATGVEWLTCDTPLEAEILELRLIAAHRPRYNRRSKYPERHTWVKITNEPYPRISYVNRVSEDGATYAGPFPHRRQAEEATLAVYEALPIRQCRSRISLKKTAPACALAEMGRCLAPCQHAVGVAEYAEIVALTISAFTKDVRPVATATASRMLELIAAEKFEEAGVLSSRLSALAAAGLRHNRLASLASCPEIIAVEPKENHYLVHIFRYGRLAAAGKTGSGEDPLTVIAALRATAATVETPRWPESAALVEETSLIAAYLERPGIRLAGVDGCWAWPSTIGLAEGELASHALGQQIKRPSPN